MLDPLQDLWQALAAIPHLASYLVFAWLVYLVWLGGWIVLQKREPAATLSWLICLAALPYLGFAVYYVFGPQKIHRQRLRRRSSRATLRSRPDGMPADPEAIELARLAQATTGLPATSASEVELLIDGDATYQALLAAVARARQHIHVEYYIFQPDRTGTLVRDALIERARAGVKVRLLLDAVGSGAVGRDFLQPLLDAGGEHAWFHPLQLGRLWRRPWLNMRNHRKLVVIDGEVAFTGGINITDEENEQLRADAYRDLHVRLRGNVVRGLQLVFCEDWAYASRQTALELPMPAAVAAVVPAQVLVSGPDSSWEAIHRAHVGAIHAARHRVWLVTPYFVPGEAARMALTSAALGGLDVRVLVPKVSDSALVTYAARSYFDELLASGVKIYEYGPRLLHTKALLCDAELVIVGSANFDCRSFRLNFELSLMFHDRALGSELEALVLGECERASRVTDDRARPLWRSRLPEALARLLSPLL